MWTTALEAGHSDTPRLHNKHPSPLSLSLSLSHGAEDELELLGTLPNLRGIEVTTGMYAALPPFLGLPAARSSLEDVLPPQQEALGRLESLVLHVSSLSDVSGLSQLTALTSLDLAGTCRAMSDEESGW